MLQILCRESVTVLDPFMAGGEEGLRALFECASTDHGLNLVVGPLLATGSDEENVPVDRISCRVIKALDLPVLPILYADMSAAMAARRSEQVFSQLHDAVPHLKQLAICFASVLNPREYQLLEIELGRRLPLLSMGYMPAHVHRDIPPEDVLYAAESRSLKITSLRSAIAQIRHMEDQILWPLVGALGQLASEWTSVPKLHEPLPKALQIGVVRHEALTVGGDSTEWLFRLLGGKVVDVSLDTDIPPDLDALWIPHGRALLAASGIVDDPRFRKGLGKMAMQNKPFLVEGESAALLGEQIVSPHKGNRGGICLVANTGYFGDTVGAAEERRVILDGVATGPLMRNGEQCRGYWPRHFQITSPTAQRGDWHVLEAKDRLQIATDGWSLKRGMISQMRLELWSCVDSVRRWLSGA